MEPLKQVARSVDENEDCMDTIGKACEGEEKDSSSAQLKRTASNCRQCPNCGFTGQTAKKHRCPAENKRCYKCKLYGHFARVCYTPRQMDNDANSVTGHTPNSSNRTTEQRKMEDVLGEMVHDILSALPQGNLAIACDGDSSEQGLRNMRDSHRQQLLAKDKQLDEMRRKLLKMQDDCARRLQENMRQMDDKLRQEKQKHKRELNVKFQEVQDVYKKIYKANEENHKEVKRITENMSREIQQMKTKYENVIKEKDSEILRLNEKILQVHREGRNAVDKIKSEMTGKITRKDEAFERAMREKDAAYEKMYNEALQTYQEEQQQSAQMFLKMQDQIKKNIMTHSQEMDRKNALLKETFSELTKAYNKITEIQELRIQESLEYTMEKQNNMLMYANVLQAIQGSGGNVLSLTEK